MSKDQNPDYILVSFLEWAVNVGADCPNYVLLVLILSFFQVVNVGGACLKLHSFIIIEDRAWAPQLNDLAAT